MPCITQGGDEFTLGFMRRSYQSIRAGMCGICSQEDLLEALVFLPVSTEGVSDIIKMQRQTAVFCPYRSEAVDSTRPHLSTSHRPAKLFTSTDADWF